MNFEVLSVCNARPTIPGLLPADAVAILGRATLEPPAARRPFPRPAGRLDTAASRPSPTLQADSEPVMALDEAKNGLGCRALRRRPARARHLGNPLQWGFPYLGVRASPFRDPRDDRHVITAFDCRALLR